MRVVKEAEERKNEILDVAERLFTAKGFDRASTMLNIENGIIALNGRSLSDNNQDSRIASKCDRVLYILDGELKGEIHLGKYEPGHDKERESSISEWLGSLGW